MKVYRCICTFNLLISDYFKANTTLMLSAPYDTYRQQFDFIITDDLNIPNILCEVQDILRSKNLPDRVILYKLSDEAYIV